MIIRKRTTHISPKPTEITLDEKGLNYQLKKHTLSKLMTGSGTISGFAVLESIHICEVRQRRVLPLYMLYVGMFITLLPFPTATFILGVIFSGAFEHAIVQLDTTQFTTIVIFPVIAGISLFIVWMFWFQSIVNVYTHGHKFVTIPFRNRTEANEFVTRFQQLKAETTSKAGYIRVI